MSKSKPVLAVFGGAFDPYTRHHHAVVKHILSNGYADKVCIVPADVHRIKNLRAGIDDRVAMISEHLRWDHMVSAINPSAKTLGVFVDQDLPRLLRGPDVTPEYIGSSLELLRAAKHKYSSYDVVMVIGEDCLDSITTWHRYKELRQEAAFLVLPRGDRNESATRKPWGLHMTVVDGFRSEGSSTEARRAVIHGDMETARSLMSPLALDYAVERGLYAVPLSTGGPSLLDDCTNYDDSGFKKALNTVDTAIVRKSGNSLEVLLIKRKWNPYSGKWALPGGFVDLKKGEGLRQAACRELEEETGAVGVEVTQLGTYGDPGRDPRGRVISVVYYAMVPDNAMDGQKLAAMDDASGFQWRRLHESTRMDDLAFDHATILKDLLQHLRTAARTTPLPFALVDHACFTWKELASSYEALLGSVVGNLSRKVLSRYDLRPASAATDIAGRGRGRPAKVFSYNGEKDPL